MLQTHEPRWMVSNLHDGVGGQDPVLDVGIAGAANCGKVTHGILGRDRFPSTRLSTHDDGLIPLISVGMSSRSLFDVKFH